MVFKIIKSTLILFFIITKINANIVYDKNNLVVTSIELEDFQELYYETYNEILSKNQAIKEIVLIKKIIEKVSVSNPNAIKKIDKSLELNFKEKFINQIKIKKDFFRFLSIKNEFISNYFQNSFRVKDLKNIFTNNKELVLPISNNNCLKIIELKDLKNDNFFIESFLLNLKENTRTFKTKINDQIFDVCINNNEFKKIETGIISYIEDKTKSEFNSFVYSKLN